MLIFAVAVAGMTEAAEPARPNVLVILADDLGWSDLGCYGGEIATPHLVREISAYLLRARKNPRLRFEKAAA